MAVDDLETLYDEIPEVFETKKIPDEFGDDWYIIPVDSVEKELPDIEGLEDLLEKNDPMNTAAPQPQDLWIQLEDKGSLPSIPGGYSGQLVKEWDKDYYPPPDALAFYMPFHFFFPKLWGVYLTIEGTIELALFIRKET